MKSSMKGLIVLLILLVTFGLPVLLQQVLNPKPMSSQQPTPVVTPAIDDIRFISVPPVIVPAGSTFVYKMLVGSISGEAVKISVLAKPEWITWDETTSQLTGEVPQVGGVFTVSMRATVPSGDEKDQTFTVTIDKQEDVKGAKTVALWSDPFHPKINAEERENVLLPGETEEESSILPPETEVLGATTVAKKMIPDDYNQYLLLGLAGVLLLVIGSIVMKIVKTFQANRSKLPPGIVIERGVR